MPSIPSPYLTKRGVQEGGNVESMGNVDVESLLLPLRFRRVDGGAGAFDEQLIVAFLMHGVVAFFALIALHAQTPKELVAEGAKGGLTEKLGDELVALEGMDLREER